MVYNEFIENNCHKNQKGFYCVSIEEAIILAIIRYCKKCKKKISIREMPNGYWLPFDFKDDQLHHCQTNNDYIKISNKPTKLDLVIYAINNNKDLIFSYRDSITKESIMRHITPSIFEDGYVTGYCYLRNDNHRFNIERMHFINIIDRISDPKGIVEEFIIEDIESEYSTENANTTLSSGSKSKIESEIENSNTQMSEEHTNSDIPEHFKQTEQSSTINNNINKVNIRETNSKKDPSSTDSSLGWIILIAFIVLLLWLSSR